MGIVFSGSAVELLGAVNRVLVEVFERDLSTCERLVIRYPQG